MKLNSKSTGFRRVLRPLFWLVGIVLSLFLVIIIAYLFSAQSAPSGKRVIKGIGDSVVITFDQADIPHIKANSPTDALFALGYLCLNIALALLNMASYLSSTAQARCSPCYSALDGDRPIHQRSTQPQTAASRCTPASAHQFHS